MNRLATVERKSTNVRDSFVVIDGVGIRVDSLVGGVCES